MCTNTSAVLWVIACSGVYRMADKFYLHDLCSDVTLFPTRRVRSLSVTSAQLQITRISCTVLVMPRRRFIWTIQPYIPLRYRTIWLYLCT